MSAPFFKSADLQKSFDEDGFARITLLSAADVDKLLKAYEPFREEHERIGLPYITTSHSSDHDLITRVDDVLQEVLAPAIDKVLVNYRLLFGNYLVKMPIANSETEPHQDITFVDESKYTSVNIWVALQDNDETNGCMYFLKGSHKFIPTIRPTHDYHWAYEKVTEEIKRASVSFPAKAGEAFIFHHGVVHGSHANTSDKPRLAAVMAAYSGDAKLIHYYLPDIKSNILQKYAMTKDAYLYFEKQKPPRKGVLLGELMHDFRQLNKNEFKRILDPGFDHYARKSNGLIKRGAH
jgi:hypothetical protein